MTLARFVAAAAMLASLSGCIARTAVTIAKAPVKVAGAVVDLATTSQSEADEKRGRELREHDERLGRLERRHRELDEECQDGDNKACAERDAVDADIESLRAGPSDGRNSATGRWIGG